MEPEEENYETDVDQINVTEVYEKFIQILSKPKIQRYEYGQLLKWQIEELYQLFCEENGIKPDFKHYNRNRYSIISQSDKRWFTWFAYKLLTLSKSDLLIFLDDCYSNAVDKNGFIGLIRSKTMRFLAKIEIPYFEEKIFQVAIWANDKKRQTIDDLDSEQVDYRLTPLKDETKVRSYFQQLVDLKFMKQDEVDHLIQANFKYGDFLAVKQFKLRIDKKQLNYFAKYFFNTYFKNSKNVALRTSAFLTRNFTNYEEEAKNPAKEKTFRKNLGNKRPDNWPFAEI